MTDAELLDRLEHRIALGDPFSLDSLDGAFFADQDDVEGRGRGLRDAIRDALEQLGPCSCHPDGSYPR